MAQRGFLGTTAAERYERQKERVKLTQRRYRTEVLQALGGKCACCGESEPAFMAIDHVGCTGAKRRAEDPGELNMTNWVRRRLKRGAPLEGIRLLCHNCNMATRLGEPCPHTKASLAGSVISKDAFMVEDLTLSP